MSDKAGREFDSCGLGIGALGNLRQRVEMLRNLLDEKQAAHFDVSMQLEAANAQIAALTAKLERVRKLVKQIEKNSPDAWARMKAEQILREVGHG